MFRIGNFIIESVDRMYLLDGPNGNLLAYSTETQEATIDFGADTVDVTNKMGTIVKRFFRNKSASLSTTQSFFNVGLAALEMGGELEYATSTNSFTRPASAYVKAGETVTLPGIVDGSEKVYGVSMSGNTSDTAYAKGTSASATEYAITSGGVLTPPTNTDETEYFVYYTQTVTKNGVKVVDSSEKFPRNVYLVIEAVGYDQCDSNNNDPMLIVIEGPSFQISAENSLTLSGGDSQTMDFSGEFLAAGCSSDQELLTLYVVDDDDVVEETVTP